MKKLLLLLFTVILASSGMMAQKMVHGTVTDDSGEALIGASVVVKGNPSNGTITDLDGKFKMKVANDAKTLVVSFIGYTPMEVEIGPSGEVMVSLASGVQLENVVVTALGLPKEKKALGYAVQEVGGEALTKANQTDAISALSGRVSGVQISSSTNMGGSSRILIRGANSITQGNQPLFIVDGIPMDNSNFSGSGASSGYGGVDFGNLMNDLNPDEIESVSVLKGPAAALYGSRAANGVVLITTKKGNKGSKGFSVDFTSKVGFESVATLPKLQRKYGGGAIVSGGVNGFKQVEYNGQKYLAPQYQVDESWGPKYDANVKVVHWDGFKEDGSIETRPWVAPVHDVEDFWDRGLTLSNAIGISKTGADYTTRFAYKNTKVAGTMPNSSMGKNDFKLAADVNLSERLNISSNLNFVKTNTIGRPTLGYTDNSVGQKFFQWGQRQLDFERLKAYKTSTGQQRTWNRQSFFDPTPKYSDNPYWTAYENAPEDSRNRLFGSLSASYELLKNLKLKGSVYGDYYNYLIRQKTAIGSQSQSAFSEATRENSEFNYESVLTYTKEFNDFSFTGLAGLNKRVTRYDFLSGNSSGGLIVPGVYNLKNSVSSAIINDYTSEKEVNSTFFTVGFDYKRMLYLEGSYRTDWSSTLPDDNNKYSYPSISGSFVFSELFNLPWLNLGKIRAGWAEVGSDTRPYNVFATYGYNSSGAFMGTPRTFVKGSLLNEDLKSETTRSREVGLDLILFNRRVDIAFTYFSNTTFDQIMPLQISNTTGYSSKYINAGEMSNKGVELSLNLVPVSLKDFEWSLGFNYTKVNNKLEKLYGDLKSLDIQRAPFGGVFLRASLGDTYGMLWGTDFIYDKNGNKVIDSDGFYMATPSLVPLGSVLPDYTLGITNSFNYKNFDLNVLFDIRKGGIFYSLSHMWGMYSGMYEETAGVNDKGNEIRDPVTDGDDTGGLILEGVTGTVTFDDDGNYTVTETKPNEKYVSGKDWAQGHYHGFGYPSAQSVFKADYIKLRELTFGYTLPTKMFKGFVKSARVALYGKNLLTFGLDKEGFDPEMTSNGSGNIQGIEGGLQPTFKSYGIILNFNF